MSVCAARVADQRYNTHNNIITSRRYGVVNAVALLDYQKHTIRDFLG